MALSYTEFAFVDCITTVIVPRGVFAFDPPSDLTELYRMLDHEVQGCSCLDQKVLLTEETQMMHRQMTGYLGTPWDDVEKYLKFSPFLLSERYSNGGMAINLIRVPVRIYAGFHKDYFDRKIMGCSPYIPTSPFLISFLRSKGNSSASFKNQFDEDYHQDGGEDFRGRHAWLGFDSKECIDWITRILE